MSLEILKPSAVQLEHGLALYRDALVCESYSLGLLAPIDGDGTGRGGAGLGYDGPPFIFQPLRLEPGRRGLRAQHLPIVRRQDQAACGKYRTREMILAYMNALAARDTETKVAI